MKTKIKKTPDWQIVSILPNGWIEVDCNSGKHRRIWKDGGAIQYLD